MLHIARERGSERQKHQQTSSFMPEFLQLARAGRAELVTHCDFRDTKEDRYIFGGWRDLNEL